MKKCPKCNIEKPPIEFGNNKSRKDGLQRVCKVCIKNYDSEYYQKDKSKIRNITKKYKNKVKEWYDSFRKNLKCEKCSENRYWVLEWHHLDPNQKEFTVGNMVYSGYSIETIKKEIDKCICVCANCHKDIHYKKTIN